MKSTKNHFFYALRMFVLAPFVPALAFSLAACEPENGGGTVTLGVAPEVSVPDGYVNYFIEDLSFSRSAGEAKVAFQINLGWTMEVVGSPSWCRVEPAFGAAGLHKVMVRVSKNNTYEPRSAKIHLMSCSSKVAEIAVIQEEGTKYEAVDLGLSVRWASCNIGATSPEEYGDYFAWGETESKLSYSSSNSATYGLSISGLKSRGIIDADGNLTAAYDAATTNWGSDWRMPTLDEMKELINECEWDWTSVNGVNGRLVTGPNGNSIFLPAAGYRGSPSLNGAGSGGYYWSATPLSSSSSAYHLDFYDGYYAWDYSYRYYGQAVRPVSE